jgi:hypothetical protein
MTFLAKASTVSLYTVQHKAVPAAIEQSAALAKFPNVSVKLSSAPLFSAEPYPFRDAMPHIRRLFDAYGPRRCYWGTDITNSFAKATYRQRITHFTEELNFFCVGRRQGVDHGPRAVGAVGVGLSNWRDAFSSWRSSVANGGDSRAIEIHSARQEGCVVTGKTKTYLHSQLDMLNLTIVRVGCFCPCCQVHLRLGNLNIQIGANFEV